MKALVRDRYGSVDDLKIQAVPTPVPKDDQILVRVRATSINDWDWGILQGGMNRVFGGLLNPKVILGCDTAGEVESVGKGVIGFKPGDRVYGDLCGSGFGAFAEYVCVGPKALRKMATGMTFEQAAAIPQAGMLAQQALFDLRPLTAGQKILINGAGGGVGTLGIQLAKAYDVEVTGVDSAIKLEMMRSLGFDHGIDYEQVDFTKTGPYDLIVDAKTNRAPGDYLRALKPNGIYATVGGTRLAKVAFLGRFYGRSEGKLLRLVGLKPNRDLEHFNLLFEQGKFRPVIDGSYSFTESSIREAFGYYGSAKQKGKVVITVD
jgi:NADPH:quinone reductase-like Zn-dependent oxidoreductase